MTILTKSAKTWTFLLFLVNWLNSEHLCFKLNAPFLIDNKVEFATSLRSKDKCYKLQFCALSVFFWAQKIINLCARTENQFYPC